MVKRDMVHTLDEGAVFLHELFSAYLRAGFTEDQALRIVIATFNRNMDQVMEADRDAST